MKPYPFALLNHLTLPVIRIVLFLDCWWHCHQTLLNRPLARSAGLRAKKKTALAAFLGSRKAGPHGDNTGGLVQVSNTKTRKSRKHESRESAKGHESATGLFRVFVIFRDFVL